jgi:epoxyqueuosine reductase QueG
MKSASQDQGIEFEERDLMSIEQASNELKVYALSLGAELYGVASVELYEKRFPGKPQAYRFVENARSIVIIGLPFEPGTMATVLRPELAGLRKIAADQVSSTNVHPAGAERYFLEEENSILNRELSLMGYKISKYLRHLGWNALHLPPSKQDRRFRTAPFYFMPAMYLAGLGTMGLNFTILTPEFGPRVVVTVIITDCPLTAGQPMTEELCDRCLLCVNNCPIQALDGEGGKNPFACSSYGCCGTCIAICPAGEM